MTAIRNTTTAPVYLRLTPGEPGVLVEPGEEIDVDDDVATELVAGAEFAAVKKSKKKTTDTPDQEGSQ
jgi:hypothetical protein